MKHLALAVISLFLLLNTSYSQPNFVFFIADDCSYWDIGCYGSVDSKTPNIDKLATEGMRFTKSYQAAPMCSPTRHNIYTGQYPVKTGAYPNHTFAMPGTKSVVQYLKPLGYKVALAGKRHIAPKEIFDFEYIGGSGNPNFNLIDEFLTQSTKEKQPFCLFICSKEPHTPWTKGDASMFNPEKVKLPEFFIDTKETRVEYCNYLAEINFMDNQVGQAMDLLKKHKLDENTVFVVTSEQGNSFPFAKWTCYDVGLHNAFVVHWSGNITKGSTSDALIDYTDVLPTFIDIAGGKQSPELDGQSFKKILLGKKAKGKKYSFGIHTTRGISNGSDLFAIRSITDGRYRLIMNLNHKEVFTNNVTEKIEVWWASWLTKAETDENAKNMIYAYQHRPEYELFDCISDPFNMNNLSGKSEYHKLEKTLKMELNEWMEYCGDKGIQTEIEAYEHQGRNKKKKVKH